MMKYMLEVMMTAATQDSWENAVQMVGSYVHLDDSAPCEALEAMENGVSAFEVEDCARVKDVICLYLKGLNAPVALSSVVSGDDEGGEW